MHDVRDTHFPTSNEATTPSTDLAQGLLATRRLGSNDYGTCCDLGLFEGGYSRFNHGVYAGPVAHSLK